MAKTQCRKCGQVYEINKPGVFLCSACGETLPPVAIEVNEANAPAVSAVPAAVTTPIAPAVFQSNTCIATLPGNVEMQLNLVRAGSFNMGSPPFENNCWFNDEKKHTVTLSQDYYMGVTEVTQGQYRAIMKDNPAYFKEDDLPVERVTWHKAMEFCERLNEYAPDGWKFTLPTETQWEFACRAGSKSAYSWGDSLNGDKANCNGNYPY
ncbi:MAG: formylglycine-generating enzyme family protein, partial [Lentisphaerae bacterium]|nr:formylglycine-generating enzyme family protein [Lentisphaerota bacterium]